MAPWPLSAPCAVSRDRVSAGTPRPRSPAADPGSRGEWPSEVRRAGVHAWRAARNAGGTSLKPPPAPRSSLPEYKRIPAPLQKTATINVMHQPVPGLPLNHTQRQKWLDFEFYLKVNPTALYFSRKSSPYQTLPHTHLQKNPTDKPRYFVSAAMPKTVIRNEKKRREGW